ncbi:MAG: pyrroline-5-carboxylate reductase [Gammaproteobacteria bacterium]|nr:pyrroline-5-carboxylate reductase [Gammaproteobacteria bacterium]MYF00111.1 pyrroline-5-carboxylate reductase [Gammaproteobacteria bacterium]
MTAQNIGFIGSGNMARSLVLGLLANGRNPAHIHAADIDAEKVEKLASEHGVNAADHDRIGQVCGLIVLAVKPQSMAEACASLRPSLAGRAPVVMSLAAGVTLTRIEELLGSGLALVRCMPNTPSLVGAGAAGLFANDHASAEQKQDIEDLMNSTGVCAWCERESDLDTITALSGSGPAYFFLFMEAMQNAACGLGLERGLAERLTGQTALGAAELARASEQGLAELRAQVTSPGGTTEAAIARFEQGGLRQLVDEAIACATERARELARENG